MSKEHRKQYRVQPNEDDPIQVSLVSNIGPTVSAELVDINVRGMGLRMAREACPDLAVGHQVEIRLKLSQNSQPMVLSGMVKNQTDDADSRRYGFLFIDPEAQRIATLLKLFNLFNRRRKKHVEPRKASPIEVSISGSPYYRKIRLDYDNATAFSTIFTSFSG